MRMIWNDTTLVMVVVATFFSSRNSAFRARLPRCNVSLGNCVMKQLCDFVKAIHMAISAVQITICYLRLVALQLHKK